MGLGYNNIKISGSLDLTRIAKDLVRNSIRDYIKKNRVSTTSPLDHIFPVERRIRWIMGGLETFKQFSKKGVAEEFRNTFYQ